MAKTNSPMGNLIRLYRKKRRCTQAALASELGWGRSFVLRLEKGTRFPDANTMILLIKFLKIPVAEVFSVYDQMPDADFAAARTTREDVKSEISKSFEEDSLEAVDNSLRGAIPDHLLRTIEGAPVGRESEIVADALELYFYGEDKLSQTLLKKLFSKEITIKKAMVDLFAELSIIETGTRHRRTKDNVAIVKLAERLCGNSAPDGSSFWSGSYLPWPLCNSLKEIITRLDRVKGWARDAQKINLWIPRHLSEIGIDSTNFDYNHFIFEDSYSDPEDSEYFSLVVKSLGMGFDISLALVFQRMYKSILAAWPYIYDMRDTYSVLAEMARLQPDESFPEPTPSVLEDIRNSLHTASCSWRQ